MLSSCGGIQRDAQTLLERLTLADLGLTTQGITSVEPTKVKYVHICETDFFSMGVFILGKGARIPLHDHPNMTVLRYLRSWWWSSG